MSDKDLLAEITEALHPIAILRGWDNDELRRLLGKVAHRLVALEAENKRLRALAAGQAHLHEDK